MKATPEDVAKLPGCDTGAVLLDRASMKATPEDVAKTPLPVTYPRIATTPQ